VKKLLPFLFILCLSFSADAKTNNNTNFDEYKSIKNLFIDATSCRALEKRFYRSCYNPCYRKTKNSQKCMSRCTPIDTELKVSQDIGRDLYIQCLFYKDKY